MILLAALPMLAWAQKVTMEFDQDSDFSRFKTFYINEGQINAKNPALNNDLVRKKIQAEIRKRLTERGLVEVTSGQRDINVRFSLGSARRQEVDVYPARWWGTRRVVTGYTEGTLVIDLRDTKQKSLVWRAIAVEDKSDAPHIESKLDDMVKKSFEQYPPKKK
jgi:hypothetical protein